MIQATHFEQLSQLPASATWPVSLTRLWNTILAEPASRHVSTSSVCPGSTGRENPSLAGGGGGQVNEDVRSAQVISSQTRCGG